MTRAFKCDRCGEYGEKPSLRCEGTLLMHESEDLCVNCAREHNDWMRGETLLPIRAIYCPKCNEESAPIVSETPEWYNDTSLSVMEHYKCKSCGHKFKIESTYKMTEYVIREDVDEKPKMNPEDTLPEIY